MGIREVLIAPRSPWQNPYAERFIGSLRRECLDHIIVFNESALRHILKAYFEYYEHSRTHLATVIRGTQTIDFPSPQVYIPHHYLHARLTRYFLPDFMFLRGATEPRLSEVNQ